MNRRTDLDLLRIVLCASVIIQHAVLIFANEPRYHVKSDLSPPWATASTATAPACSNSRIFNGVA